MEASEERAAGGKAKAALKIVIRVGVGVGVLGYLVFRQDSERVLRALGDARPGWLIAAFGAILAGLLVSALRWRVYLRALDLDLELGTLFRLYFVGTFFNAFLPTGIGGDAYKAVRVSRGRGEPGAGMSPALASVFLDRFAGIVGLSALGFIATLSEIAVGERGPVIMLALALTAGVVVAALAVLLGGDRLAGVFLPDRGLTGRMRKLVRTIERGGRSRATLGPGLAFGILFQLLVLGYHLAIARSVGIQISIAETSAIVVIASLATMIPITINGLGFRETAYTWALADFGVPHGPTRAAFALLVLGVLLASSAIGGVVYVIAGGEVQPKKR